MAYIGKVKVSDTWTKLEDLIKAQIDGQSSFAFSSGSTYSLQTDGDNVSFIRVCNATSTPAESYDGECLDRHICGLYKPDTAYLYVRKEGHPVYLSVSENA